MKNSEVKLNILSQNLSEQEKIDSYNDAVEKIDAVLKGESFWILKMATIINILRESLPYYYWTGFYIVHKGELVVGPYQGTFGCLHIEFGRGVCGTAAKTLKTQIVADVNKFKGHIACDSKSKSEIVVPVFNSQKKLIAVFDVDSTDINSFDSIDKKYLEKILKKHFTISDLEY